MSSKQKFSFSVPALRVLENEHQLLTYLMGKWQPLVLRIEREHFRTEGEARMLFRTIRREVNQFLKPLKLHTDKEKAYLYPALAKYVGNEQGPVQAIQEEHAEIEAYFDHFLHFANVEEKELTIPKMQEIVQDAQEAFEVVTFHLIKEETIIFPMVESILNDKEQYDLLEKMYSSII